MFYKFEFKIFFGLTGARIDNNAEHITRERHIEAETRGWCMEWLEGYTARAVETNGNVWSDVCSKYSVCVIHTCL